MKFLNPTTVTIWSPDFNKKLRVVNAPKPDENVKAYLAFSNGAKHSSKLFLVGLPLLPYSKPA
jgi:hypothetical protein